MNFLQFREEVKDLQAYKAGKPIEHVMREFNITDVIKLASNENPLGYSPKAKEAILNAIDTLSLYPDGTCLELKEALSKKYNIDTKNIIPSCGSDEMIDHLCKAFINKNDEVLMADVTFPRYITTSKMMGGIIKTVPMKDFTYDIEGIYNAITDKTKIIWICNPNNPTGTMIPTSEIIDLLDKTPKHIVVVLDEAYREYVTRKDYMMDSEKLIDKYSNLIVLRTFSKVYGLAGLRIGFAIAHEDIIENLNKVRPAFNINSLAQVAAIAALDDDEFLKKSYDLNKEGKEYIYSELKAMSIQYYPSETNHIFMDIECNANEVFEELQKLGIIIRPITKNHIRVSIGTMEQNTRFINGLKQVLSLVKA